MIFVDNSVRTLVGMFCIEVLDFVDAPDRFETPQLFKSLVVIAALFLLS